MKTQTELRELLKQRFDELKKKNSSFSLRSFARSLDLSPATLSEFLNGKRNLSALAERKIATNMDFGQQLSKKKYTKIGNEHGHIIADWIYFSILSLIETNQKLDARSISHLLDVPKTKVEASLEELISVGLIRRDKDGFSLLETELVTTDDLANKHLKQRHLENLDRAKASLEKDEVKNRDFTFLTLAIAKKDLKKYKRMVRKFQDDIVKVQSGSEKDCVYEFCFQIFPVSRK